MLESIVRSLHTLKETLGQTVMWTTSVELNLKDLKTQLPFIIAWFLCSLGYEEPGYPDFKSANSSLVQLFINGILLFSFIKLPLYTAAAKMLQSCPTLRDPIDGSPPGSAVPGILQARTLEWGATAFSNAWKWKSEREVTQSCPTLSDPMDWSPPGSSIHGIFQARVLEWGAIAFSV